MKSSWLLRIGIIVLILTLITSCLVSVTYAKFTTTVSGRDTVVVARFAFKVNDGNTEYNKTKTESANIAIFENAKTDAEGTVDVDEDGQIMFAPGIYGSFSIVIDNSESDVDVVLTGSNITSSIDRSMAEFNTSTSFLSFVISDRNNENAVKAIASNDDYGQRSTLVELDTALTSYISDYIVAKHSKVTIDVFYKWISIKTVKDDPNTPDIDETVNGTTEADTAIGKAIALPFTNGDGEEVIASPIIETKIIITGSQLLEQSPSEYTCKAPVKSTAPAIV